jgi:hypothetical protein
MEDVVSKGIEALRLYAEDTQLPAPRPIEQVRKDKGVASDLAHGAFLIAVSKTMPGWCAPTSPWRAA